MAQKKSINNKPSTLSSELIAQWHPTKNGELKPHMVKPGSQKKVWWLCPDCNYEWEAIVSSRSHGTGCPVCRGRRVVPGFNDLATMQPELAAQWHPTKNGELEPRMVMPGSNKKVWWRCTTCGYEWESFIKSRSRGIGCPECYRQIIKLMPGTNDLATINPELAAQWHPTKNGKLSPQKVTIYSQKKVWWRGPCGHEWEAIIKSRSQKGDGCPICTGRRVVPGVNDLATVNSELAAQWHPTKNGNLKPNMVKLGSNRQVWWLCPDCGHEWEAKIANRAHGTGCPECHRRMIRLTPGVNDLATMKPELAAQWHPTKNGTMSPHDVTFSSHKKVWWLGPCGHEWKAMVQSRSIAGSGCSVCAGRTVLPGVNDLATTRPELAAQWNPTRNGDLTAQMVTAGNGKKVWWICAEGHEWQAEIRTRAGGSGCPCCAGKYGLTEKTNLAAIYPELAAQWHPTRNGNLKPHMMMLRSKKKVWWVCPSCGRDWEALISNRTRGSGCATCVKQKTRSGVNDLATIKPELAAQWHPTKNGELKPDMVTIWSDIAVWWKGSCGHEWQESIKQRAIFSCRCPVCAEEAVQEKE